jgi:hypothetical protein
MPIQQIVVNMTITWTRLINNLKQPYKWGDNKDMGTDVNWGRRNLIYRWVKNSTGEVAHIGETERKLTERVNNYMSAIPSSQAGKTNKKVFAEQQSLSKMRDYLYLEFTDTVPGYNLNDNRERRLAEKLLIGATKPYLE